MTQQEKYIEAQKIARQAGTYPEVEPVGQQTGEEAASQRAAVLAAKIRERREHPTVKVGVKTNSPVDIERTREIQDLKRDDPKLYGILKNKGIDAYQKAVRDINKEVTEYNQSLIASAMSELQGTKHMPRKVRDEKTIGTVKTVWRTLTPWDEGQETFLDYAKGWPGRVLSTVKQNINPKRETQAELKKEYERQEEFNKNAPMWAKILGGDNEIVKTKDGLYLRGLMSEAPDVGKKAAVKAASKAAVKSASKVAVKEYVDWRKILQAAKNAKYKKVWDDFSRASKAKAPTKTPGKTTASRGRPTVRTKGFRDYRRQLESLQRIGQENKSLFNARTTVKPVTIKRVTRIITAMPTDNLKVSAAASMAVDIKLIPAWETALKAIQAQKQATSPAVKEKIATDTLAAVMFAEAIKVAEATGTSVLTQLQNMTDTMPDTQIENQVKQQLKNMTSQQTKQVPSKPTPKQPRQDKPTSQKKQPPQYPTPDRPPVKKKLKPKLPDTTASTKNRQKIKDAETAICWRQGQLHGKSRWDTIIEPFTDKAEYLIVIGKKPTNAVEMRGAGTAAKTAIVQSGRLSKGGITDLPGAFSLIGKPLDGGKKIHIQQIPDSLVRKKSIFPLRNK